MIVDDLPVGDSPQPVALPHFPDTLSAFIWRNWTLVPLPRLAKVVGARPEQVRTLGKAMGLPDPPRISANQLKRTALTLIRRNWHLLPYEQLLTLLEWTPEQLAFSLREDDFLYIKFGSRKPRCAPVRWKEPDAATQAHHARIAAAVRNAFPNGLPKPTDPLFGFLKTLEKAPARRPAPAPSRLSPRYCYSYFALYGDPLLEKDADPYPDGYLAQLAAAGVDGVWLQGVLQKLAPFPFEPSRSARYDERLVQLNRLVARAKAHGIGIWLYLNEPRALPLAFFESRPQLKGVTEGDHATLCTSVPDVRRYLADAIATICKAVPDLAGFFTISGSENLTHCWSHGGGVACPRCSKTGVAATIAGANSALQDGIRQAGGKQTLITWDWGWPDAAVPEIIAQLPTEVRLMSVSEWDLPIARGGIATTVGEYSLSAVGPGPRAQRHWQLAKARGLKTLAKIQAACSWELSAIPYVPAVANTAQHAANLQAAQIDGLMLGWTLGGFPSPNLEVVAEVGRGLSADAALRTVAQRRFGRDAEKVVALWQQVSAAYREFPFHIQTVYTAPLQYGPSNLLWNSPTGYPATMTGFPYDDLNAWRAVYPPEIFIAQLRKVADGFLRAMEPLQATTNPAVRTELRLVEVAALHFASVADQCRFVQVRQDPAARREREQLLLAEGERARRLLVLQSEDSRIGFEASNQYYYVSVDLLEKYVNTAYLRGV